MFPKGGICRGLFIYLAQFHIRSTLSSTSLLSVQMHISAIFAPCHNVMFMLNQL